MERRHDHLYERVEIKEGESLLVNADRPIHINFYSDEEYPGFRTHNGWSNSQQQNSFPVTIDAPGPGHWNIVVNHLPDDTPTVSIDVV